ncbi:hypothetical protein LIA77_01033 [Sarocladium implicatum]|nr:hypothetical protein LIA77_01033 [Sarocladium implicatum]
MDDRPGLYVRFEVGVSWPRHMHKRRSISYTSGGLRDRSQRALPPAAPDSTALQHHRPTEAQLRSDQAYLRHIYNYASHNTNVSEYPDWQQPSFLASNQYTAAQPGLAPSHHDTHVQGHHFTPYRAACEPATLPLPHGDPPMRRSRSPSSHNSRGSSAPPPTHDRPWDDEPEPMASTAVPVRKAIPLARSHMFKPLPATPNQFRLGDDLMPWTGSPDPAAYSAVEDSRRGQAEGSLRSHGSPAKQFAKSSKDDQERGRTVEMQSLATALMTVDNGFEDQWWYQGPRMMTMAGDLIAPAPFRDMYEQTPDIRGYSKPPSGPQFQANTPASTVVDLVSPLSGHSSLLSPESSRDT